MKLDVDKVFMTLEGKPFKGPEEKDLNMKDLILILMYDMGDKKKLNGVQKIERNKIANKAYAGGVVEFDLNEITKIKKALDDDNSLHVKVVADALELLEEAAK